MTMFSSDPSLARILNSPSPDGGPKVTPLRPGEGEATMRLKRAPCIPAVLWNTLGVAPWDPDGFLCLCPVFGDGPPLP